MEKEMKELYGNEGLATHTGPESCAGSHKGAGEAFDRGTRRQSYRAAKTVTSRRRRRHSRRKATRTRARMRALDGLARSKNSGGSKAVVEGGCMRGISMRENREVP